MFNHADLPPHLSVCLQRLQLSLVGLLSQRLIDLGHDWDLFTSVVDGCVVLGLWQIPHEPQNCDPDCQSGLRRQEDARFIR